MIGFSKDQLIALATTAFKERQFEACIDLLDRVPNSSGVSQLRVLAAYRAAKNRIAEGALGRARELFSEAGKSDKQNLFIALCQERIRLIRNIQAGLNTAVTELQKRLGDVRVAGVERLDSGNFEPTIWYVGCAAAYRSGYSRLSGDPLSRLIRLAKKGVEEHVLARLGEFLSVYTFSRTPVLEKVDLIVPVPGDPERVSQRGYSIPLLLAAEISSACAVPLHPEILETSGSAPELRHIPRWYRGVALEGAFHTIKEQWLQGRSVLIVDDVITTGSTVLEVGRMLLDAGADEVAAVALAHTEG